MTVHRMLRKGFSPRKAMAAFDRAFKFSEQEPPVVRKYMQDPHSAFVIDAYALISKWSEKVLSQLLTELCTAPAPPDVAAMMGRTKALLHEVMGDTEDPSSSLRLRNLAAWPHVRRKPEDVVIPEGLSQQEMLEMSDKISKQATQKKVTAKKVAAKKADGPKAKEGTVAVRDATKLRVVAGSPTPNKESKAAVKRVVKGTMTAEQIMQKSEDCTLRLLGSMVKWGHLEIVK